MERATDARTKDGSKPRAVRAARSGSDAGKGS